MPAEMPPTIMNVSCNETKVRNVESHIDLRPSKSSYRKMAAKIRYPNGEKWITKLYTTFTHIEYEQRDTSNDNGTQMFPVNFQRISFAIVLDLKSEFLCLATR